MGRPAQKVEAILSKGKSHHLTKAEIKRRKEAEIKLGKNDISKIKVPDMVKNDVVAYKMWQTAMKDYKNSAKNGFEIITTADMEALAEYCLTYSELEMLKQKIRNLKLKLSDYLKLDTSINKKRDQLIKQQKNLFRNPLSRVQNVPKKEKDKPNNPMEDEFDV